jgi:glycosyltransferase involved in cell wall biosynthesis/multidrug transporter EmrE-like cation transporter
VAVKVLVVSSYPPRHCGIGAYARDQVERLRGEGHQVTVLSPPDGDGELKAPFLGGRPFYRAARLARRQDRVVVHFQPGLYYRRGAPVSKVKASLGLLWLAFRAGRRLDLVVHEADPPALWRPDYFLLRLAFATAGRLSFHTRAEREALERLYRVRVRASLIAHRVGPVERVSREGARRRLGLANGPAVFVCPGFLQASKGFDRAVEALAGVPDGASLYVVGSIRDRTPETEAYVRDLAERCRADPRATLVERFLSDEEFDLWVAAADWVVLPYRRAWSSGVLARAHALGTPAIVSAVGGLSEQAGEGDVVVENDEGLAQALHAAASSRRTAGTVRPPNGLAGASSDEYQHSGRLRKRDRRGIIVLIGLILISVALAATAQLTLKHAMNVVTDHGAEPLSLLAPAETVRRIVLNPFVWGGLLMFGLSASVWLIVLSRTSLSFAYPFASLTYVLILLFDRLALHQPISAVRYAGVALIIGGLVLISRTHSTA